MTSLSVPCPNPKCVTTAFTATNCINNNPSLVSFPNAAASHSNSLRHNVSRSTSVMKLQAQIDEVAITESSNSIPKSSKEAPASSVIPDADSINVFMAQVSDLVKLVDSRDIVELELKQQGCELLIRKKEAIPIPPALYAAPQYSYYTAPAPPQAPAAGTPAKSSPPASLAPALPAPAKITASLHPPLKCPMAGTLYRCPGPGEPPFVKVGDKVQKGQVICIIEAMKLMNEIEADQSGMITEILVEDGKPVSVDLPLFVIAP